MAAIVATKAHLPLRRAQVILLLASCNVVVVIAGSVERISQTSATYHVIEPDEKAPSWQRKEKTSSSASASRSNSKPSTSKRISSSTTRSKTFTSGVPLRIFSSSTSSTLPAETLHLTRTTSSPTSANSGSSTSRAAATKGGANNHAEHSSRLNLTLAILLPILAVAAAVIWILLYLRRRKNQHAYRDVRSNTFGTSSADEKSSWRTMPSFAIPSRPAFLGGRQQDSGAGVPRPWGNAPSAFRRTSLFTAGHNTVYSPVRRTHDGTDGFAPANILHSQTAYKGAERQSRSISPAMGGANPFSDGRSSPWKCNGRSPSLASSGRGTPDGPNSRPSRPRNLSQISLPLPPEQDPTRRSSTPLAWSAERIQSPGRTTVNPFDGRDSPDAQPQPQPRDRSSSMRVRISLPLAALEDPASAHASSPLAWSADRITGDGTGRSIRNPFENPAFVSSPASVADLPYEHSGRGSRLTCIAQHDDNSPPRALGTKRTSVPVMLAPSPGPTTTTFAAAINTGHIPDQLRVPHKNNHHHRHLSSDESSSIIIVDSNRASAGTRSDSLEADDGCGGGGGGSSTTELRSHAGTIRSVTTIRSSVDSAMAARLLEDMPPLPAGFASSSGPSSAAAAAAQRRYWDAGEAEQQHHRPF